MGTLGLCIATGDPFVAMQTEEESYPCTALEVARVTWAEPNMGCVKALGLLLSTSRDILWCPWRSCRNGVQTSYSPWEKAPSLTGKPWGNTLATAAAGRVFNFFCSFGKYQLKPGKMLEDFVVILHDIVKE